MATLYSKKRSDSSVSTAASNSQDSPVAAQARAHEKAEKCSDSITDPDSPVHADRSIMIFDWDDTLCASSFINVNRPPLSYTRPPPNDERFVKPFEELEEAVTELLELSLTFAQVVIVTNAKEPWVTTSSLNFMPRVLKLFDRIPVLYGQSIWNSSANDHVQKKVIVPRSLLSPNNMHHATYLTEPRPGQNIRIANASESKIIAAGQSQFGERHHARTNSATRPATSSLSTAVHQSRKPFSSKTFFSRPKSDEHEMRFAPDVSKPSVMNENSKSAFELLHGNPNIDKAEIGKLCQKMRLQSSGSPANLCLRWKELSFAIVLARQFLGNQRPWSNVISIGDAEYERIATKRVVASCIPPQEMPFIKTVKFADNPTISELILQVRSMIKSLPQIVKKEGNVDIEVDTQDLTQWSKVRM